MRLTIYDLRGGVKKLKIDLLVEIRRNGRSGAAEGSGKSSADQASVYYWIA